MKLPRDLSGVDLSKALERFGYSVTRTTGSHIRMSTQRGGQHHVTIPAHGALRVGTLSAVLADVAQHHQISKPDLIQQLFG